MSDDGDLPQIELTSAERDKLESTSTLNGYQRNKLDKDSKKNWDLFYKRNGDRFFKNRFWTKHEFHELFRLDRQTNNDDDDELKYLLELGCGCGDFVLPLLDDDTKDDKKPIDLFIYCCDISNQAIEILKTKPAYLRNNPKRIKAFTADITSQDVCLSYSVDNRLMDVVSLVFVLSAIDPDKFPIAVNNMSKVLKPGGLVLFRDYAIYDKAMLRFSEQSKIADQFYARQDGTRAYFFTKKQLVSLFTNCDFQCQSIDYVKRETVNNATKDKYSRIFLQAKFMKLERKT